jgi:hypothetical protein
MMMMLMTALTMLVTIRNVALNVDEYVKANMKEDAGTKTCEYSEGIAPGDWIAPDRWKPRASECEYANYTDTEFGTCMALKYRRLAFFGDSLLLNVFIDLTRRLERAGHGTLGRRSSNFYSPGGRQEFIFNRTSSSSSPLSFTLDKDNENVTKTGGGGDDDRRRLVFWWTPSSFHANIHQYEKGFDALDGAVFGMAAWDMGTYFRGANAFRDRFSDIVNDASGRGVPTFVFGLHKLWRERCEDPKGPCARCNTAGKERAFREAVGHAATCGASRSSSSSSARGKERANVILVDTYGFTDTPEAMADGEDALHYGKDITSMEATHFANVMCRNDDFARRQRHDYGCRGDNPVVIDLDSLISREEALPCA